MTPKAFYQDLRRLEVVSLNSEKQNDKVKEIGRRHFNKSNIL
jgi:hypothetical protein